MDKEVSEKIMNEIDNDILKAFEPMFKEANEKKLFFFCHYQQIWLSPSELRKEHEQGRFVWSVRNWELRDPAIRLHHIEEEITDLQRKKAQLKARIQTGFFE